MHELWVITDVIASQHWGEGELSVPLQSPLCYI